MKVKRHARRKGEDEFRGFSAWDFVHDELLPHLHGLKAAAGATPRQKVVSEIMGRVIGERDRASSPRRARA